MELFGQLKEWQNICIYWNSIQACGYDTVGDTEMKKT